MHNFFDIDFQEGSENGTSPLSYGLFYTYPVVTVCSPHIQ